MVKEKVKNNNKIYFLNLRTSEIHLFYNLQLFYWHFLEILWLFIFLVFYGFYINSIHLEVAFLVVLFGDIICIL